MNPQSGHYYIPGFSPEENTNHDDWALVLHNRKILMKKVDSQYSIPEKEDLTDDLLQLNDLEYIGSYGEHNCYCAELKVNALIPEKYELIDLRELTDVTGDPGLFILAGSANHILHWNNANRYCGHCGHATTKKKDERAMVCSNCSNVVYPRISPATITAVFRGNQILLAHNRNFGQNLYSLIAGFVEPGETLEQCVAREIFEEVGIKVKNITYYSSQPWPFPDSLMLAFTAEYESGEIAVDNTEILDAGWYHADSLPVIPSIDSVAGKMIRWYRDQYTLKSTSEAERVR